MEYPTLDEETQRELNELKLRGNREAYGSIAQGYGLIGIAHVLLFRQAREVIKGKVSLDDFIRMYRLHSFSGEKNPPLLPSGYRYYCGGFTGFIHQIKEHNNIFLTKDLLDDRLYFVSSDYINELRDLEKKEYYDRTAYLAKRTWLPQDFTNPELVEDGIRFGRMMWCNVVRQYDDLSKGPLKGWDKNGTELRGRPQFKKITIAGRKLIAYYDKIVNATNPLPLNPNPKFSP